MGIMSAWLPFLLSFLIFVPSSLLSPSAPQPQGFWTPCPSSPAAPRHLRCSDYQPVSFEAPRVIGQLKTCCFVHQAFVSPQGRCTSNYWALASCPQLLRSVMSQRHPSRLPIFGLHSSDLSPHERLANGRRRAIDEIRTLIGVLPSLLMILRADTAEGTAVSEGPVMSREEEAVLREQLKNPERELNLKAELERDFPELNEFVRKNPRLIQMGKENPGLIELAKSKPALLELVRDKPGLIDMALSFPGLLDLVKDKPVIIAITKANPWLVDIAVSTPELVQYVMEHPETLDSIENAQWIATLFGIDTEQAKALYGTPK